MGVKELFTQKLTVVNIGIQLFSDTLREQGVTAIHVNWRPPAGGDKELAKLLEKIK